MAIIAVDVVGYSRLMANDEDGTLAALRELRGLIDPIFESGGGRIVKSTGDGILVEAPSVIEATRASIEAQQAVRAWNRDRPEPMRLRIGINLGDVVVDDTGDIYGDGVNVAARLEGLADPGGICLSEAAFHQVRGRIDVPLTDRGEQHVKNIPRPIRVWSIDLEGGPARRRPPRKVLIVSAALLAIGLIAGGSVALFSGEDPPTAETTTTAPPGDDGLVALDAAVWVVGFEDPIDSVAAAGDSVVVALTSGELHALDGAGGSQVWQTSAGGRVSSIAVMGGLTVFVTENSRVVHALDATGEEAWRSLIDLESAQTRPLVDLTEDGVFAALGFGVTRLDPGTGTEVWVEGLVANLNIDALSAGRTVLGIGDGRFVHGVDPITGATVWEVGPPDVSGGVAWVRAWVVEIEGGFSGELEGRILVLTGDQDLVSIDGQTGSVRWTAPVSGTPGLSDEVLYVAGVDGELVALQADGGDVEWSQPDVEPAWPPLVDGDTLLVIAGSELLVLNPRSGSTRSSIDLGAEPTGPPVVVGDVVVIPFGSTLAAFRVG